MVSISEQLQILCTVDGDDDLVFIKVDLLKNNEHLTTIEFADITSEFKDLLQVNKGIDIYKNNLDLKSDIATAHLFRYLKKDRDTPQLDLLLNLRMKFKHQEGLCKNSCILCNPELGEDPFPDFIFEAKHCDPEGEA